MKWEIKARRKLYDLLEEARPSPNFRTLGIRRIKREPFLPPDDPEYVVIPDPKSLLKISPSLVTVHYVSRYKKRSAKYIASKIKGECMINCPPSLVRSIRAFVDFGVGKAKKEPITIYYLKIPKDIAEKFLVLGIP